MNTRSKKSRLLRWMPGHSVLTTGPAAGNRLYLTFDDGPDPEVTPQLIDLLARHGARASFFLVGERAELRPDLVTRLLAGGHRIGNHSYTHPRFDAITVAAQDEEIARSDRLLCTFDGSAMHLFRPPYGVLPLSLIIRAARARRRIAYWSMDSLDYQDQPVEVLIDLLRRQPPRAGDIVLMHDRPHTLELLGTMLPEWRQAGFVMEALPAIA